MVARTGLIRIGRGVILVNPGALEYAHGLLGTLESALRE
jgi:hypothetical protein